MNGIVLVGFNVLLDTLQVTMVTTIFQPITWQLQKTVLYQIKLRPSYNTKT